MVPPDRRALRWALEEVRVTEHEYDSVLTEIKEQKAWEVFPTPDKPYGSLDVMLKEELGLSQNQAKTKKEMQQAKVVGQLLVDLTRKRAGRPSKLDNSLSDNEFPDKQGTSTGYLISRIKSDHPDIAARMVAGEFTSVKKAAIEAGIVKKDITIPIDPGRAARLLHKHFQGASWQALLDALEALK